MLEIHVSLMARCTIHILEVGVKIKTTIVRKRLNNTVIDYLGNNSKLSHTKVRIEWMKKMNNTITKLFGFMISLS